MIATALAAAMLISTHICSATPAKTMIVAALNASLRHRPPRRLAFPAFYTLSPASIEYRRAPALAEKGLARYDVPVFLLGRLAVDRGGQGRDLGGGPLLRASDRGIRVAAEVSGVALP